MGLLILVIVFVGLFVFLFVAAFKQAKKEEQEWEEKKVAHRAWLKKFGYDNSKVISDKREHFVDLCTEKKKLIIDERSYAFDTIVSCELVTKVSSTTTTNGGLAAAAIGGIVGGNAGAIAGSNMAPRTTTFNTDVEGVKIYFNDANNPSMVLKLKKEASIALYDALYVILAQKEIQPRSSRAPGLHFTVFLSKLHRQPDPVLRG